MADTVVAPPSDAGVGDSLRLPGVRPISLQGAVNPTRPSVTQCEPTATERARKNEGRHRSRSTSRYDRNIGNDRLLYA